MGGATRVTILVVEPDPALARTIRTALEPAGYQVLHLPDAGPVALTLARQARPAAILLTLDPADVGGAAALLTELKADPETAAIPVITLGSGGDDGDGSPRLVTPARAAPRVPSVVLARPVSHDSRATVARGWSVNGG